MLKGRPLISVTMATHDRPELLLTRSVPSVLRQTYDNWELVIRGDGAGSETESAIYSFNDARIKYENLPRRLYPSTNEQWSVGGAHALNAAVEAAKGQYIAHLDDDDQLLPHHLETLLKLLISENCDIAYGRAYFQTNDGWIVFGEPFDRSQLIKENPMVHSAVMYDRAKLGHLRYSTEGTEPADWNMWRKMAAVGARFGYTRDVVAVYYAEESYRHRRGLKLSDLVASVAKRAKICVQGHGLLNPISPVENDLTTAPGILTVASRRISRTVTRQQFLKSGLLPKPQIPPEESDRIKLTLERESAAYGSKKAELSSWVREMAKRDDNSVDLIYGERAIEQLSFEEARAVLGECYRVLKPAGIIRVATEDLGILAFVLDHVWKQKGLCGEQRLRNCLRQCGFRDFERHHQGESNHAELRYLETRRESTLIIEAMK